MDNPSVIVITPTVGSPYLRQCVNSVCSQTYDNIPVLWKYTRFPYGDGQLIFDTLVRERAVGDVYNSIFCMTATPDREVIMESQTNYPSMYDKDSPGFLGYLKLFFQQEAVFGSGAALHRLIQNYKKFTTLSSIC